MRRPLGMVIVGTDSHKRTHTVVAVDGVGRRLDVKTVRTNSEGHLELVRWSARFGEVTFALEDCRHLTRRLEADLLAAGLARGRRGSPTRSTPRRSPWPRCGIPDCRSPSLMARRERSSCCRITAAIWWCSAPGSPRRSAGTCTN